MVYAAHIYYTEILKKKKTPRVKINALRICSKHCTSYVSQSLHFLVIFFCFFFLFFLEETTIKIGNKCVNKDMLSLKHV